MVQLLQEMKGTKVFGLTRRLRDFRFTFLDSPDL